LSFPIDSGELAAALMSRTAMRSIATDKSIHPRACIDGKTNLPRPINDVSKRSYRIC
jgi:hypothetical protein